MNYELVKAMPFHRDIRSLPRETDREAWAHEGDTITFDVTVEVTNNGFSVQKTYYHEITVKEIRDGGVLLRLVAKGLR